MKSRMAITAMLVVGMLMSTSGVGLAISGSSGSGSAAGTQYQQEHQNNETIAPSSTEGTAKTTPAVQASNDVQSTEQVAATQQSSDRSSLPFTGYNAVPILLGGLALLAVGLVLRRQTRRDRA